MRDYLRGHLENRNLTHESATTCHPRPPLPDPLWTPRVLVRAGKKDLRVNSKASTGLASGSGHQKKASRREALTRWGLVRTLRASKLVRALPAGEGRGRDQSRHGKKAGQRQGVRGDGDGGVKPLDWRSVREPGRQR